MMLGEPPERIDLVNKLAKEMRASYLGSGWDPQRFGSHLNQIQNLNKQKICQWLHQGPQKKVIIGCS